MRIQVSRSIRNSAANAPPTTAKATMPTVVAIAAVTSLPCGLIAMKASRLRTGTVVSRSRNVVSQARSAAVPALVTVELGHQRAVLAAEAGAGRGAAGRGRDARALHPVGSREEHGTARVAEQRLEPVDLGHAGALPGGGDAVVAPPLVVERRVGPRVALLDEPFAEHALDRPVQGARPHAHGAVGELLDALHQRVAVLLTVAQRGSSRWNTAGGSGPAAAGFRALAATVASSPGFPRHRRSIDRRYIGGRYSVGRARQGSIDAAGRSVCRRVAEGEGFEPSKELFTPYSLSRRALSASQSSLRVAGQCTQPHP